MIKEEANKNELEKSLKELSEISEIIGYNRAISCVKRFKLKLIDHLRSLGNPRVNLKDQGYIEGMFDTFDKIVAELEENKPLQ
jgi:hypothetical protein